MKTKGKIRKISNWSVNLQFMGTDIKVKARSSAEAKRKAIQKFATAAQIRKHLNDKTTTIERTDV